MKHPLTKEEVNFDGLRMEITSGLKRILFYLEKQQERSVRIILFGSGEMGQLTLEICKEVGIHPDAYIEDEASKAPASFDSLRSITLTELVKLKEEFLIILSNHLFRELGTKLINLNLEFEKDFFLSQKSISTLQMKYEIGTTFIGKNCHGFEKFLSLYSLYVQTKVIGAFCSIAADAKLITQHVMTNVSTSSFIEWGGSQDVNDFPNEDFLRRRRQLNGVTEIGNDVWIGYRAILMPGIKVGDGAVIGAGSVITKNVPPFAVVTGSPAKVVRYRYSRGQIEILKALRWWNWNDAFIRRHIDKFYDEAKFFALAEEILADPSELLSTGR